MARGYEVLEPDAGKLARPVPRGWRRSNALLLPDLFFNQRAAYGSSATAAYGAATQILSWVQFPAMSLGIAAAIFSARAVVGVELPVAVALEARFGLAGVFWACPAAFLAMLVLHGLYYRHKEKKDGLFPQPGVALGAAGGRTRGA